MKGWISAPRNVTFVASAKMMNSSRQMPMQTIVSSSSSDKILWITTSDKSVVTTALEGGHNTIFFKSSQSEDYQEDWNHLGRLRIVKAAPDGSLIDQTTQQSIGRLLKISNAADLAIAEKAASGITIIEATDWQIIPAENLVASFQNKSNSTLLTMTTSAADSRVMLEALEVGTHGVVLQTNNPHEVRELLKYLEFRKKQGSTSLKYDTARVVSIKPVDSMGERGCIDLAERMVPGEGLLVGSFARALFLVHSECDESEYVNSRPFRVNAGPVHSYVQIPGGKTKYISELRSGDEVEIVNVHGKKRNALVGRVKIERRPLFLVEAATEDGCVHSILLQNAETVKLIGVGNNTENKIINSNINWRAISVSEMKVGDEVYILQQAAARHTGVEIEESITEK